MTLEGSYSGDWNATEHLNSRRLDFEMESHFRVASRGKLDFAAKGQSGGAAKFQTAATLLLGPSAATIERQKREVIRED